MSGIVDSIKEKFGSYTLDPMVLMDFGYECVNSAVRQYIERSDYTVWERPSGFNCARKKACIKHGVEGEPLELRSIDVFFNGDLHEAATVLQAKMAGEDIRYTGREQLTLETALGPGHTDGIRFVEGREESILECKSMSDYGFQKFRKLPERCSIVMLDDTFGYATQGDAYIDGFDSEHALPLRMIGVNKLNLAKHEVIFDFDFGILERRKEEVKLIRACKSPWELPRFEPAIDNRSGREKLPVQCSYCSFKHPCWKADGFRLKEEKMGRGKVYWVTKNG